MRVVVAVMYALAAPAAAAPPPEAAAALQEHLHQLIEAAEPSVACVLVSRSGSYAELGQGPSSARDGKLGEFGPPPGIRAVDAAQRELIRRLDLANPDTVPEAFGSGVAIDNRGLVLTAFHVVDGATKVFVRLPGAGRGSYADILAGDPRADLAVLRMIRTPADLKAIPIGDGGKVRKGDWVVGLANPFAAGFRDGSPSASCGIVSNLRRRVPGPADEFRRVKPLAQYATLLQTDVRLNLGCSGGALLNMDGELIGLTTALAALVGGDAGGGYAVPTDTHTQRMIEVLKRGEEIEYGLLGVTVNPEERGDGRGVMIQDVSPGMPAARAGLLARDVVTAINGNPVRDQEDLFLHISAALAGTEAAIEVRRGNRPQTFKARLAKAPPGEFADKVIAPNRPRPVHGLTVDYASTLGATAGPPEGVLVKVVPDSPAAKKLRDGMIVISVNGEPVPTPADFRRLATGKGPITLEVVELGAGAAPRKVTLP